MVTKSEVIEKIIEFLESIAPLTLRLKKALHGLLVIEQTRRRHTFLEPGQVSDRVYFIMNGLVRAYYLEENVKGKGKAKGKRTERTSWIMKERDVIIGVRSFSTREPSKEYIETLEPTIVGSISYDELEMLYRKFPRFERVGRILYQTYNVLANGRADLLRANNATEKYRVFTENHPELVKRVATRYIASYLGIKEETLYRIKKANYGNSRSSSPSLRRSSEARSVGRRSNLYCQSSRLSSRSA